MHPVEQYIQSLSRRLQRKLTGHENPEEVFRAARQLCDGSLDWLASRVSEETIRQRTFAHRNHG